MDTPRCRTSLLLGIAVGFVFGVADLILTWLRPLEDDTPVVLLRFYGPMFLVWAFVAFKTAPRSGLLSGVLDSTVVAFATFCVFVLLNFVRVNLFLYQLTGRADWHNIMSRFHAERVENLRLFVNLIYLKGTPLKIAVASALGAVLGAFGGFVGLLFSRPPLRSE